MTSKPPTPSTEAGRALLDEGAFTHETMLARILAIESEARADAEHAERSTLDNTRELVRQHQQARADADRQIAVLREALDSCQANLTHLRERLTEKGDHIYAALGVLNDAGRRALLNSPDSAVKEYESRIREDAVKPYQTMVGRLASYIKSGEGWNEQDEADLRSLLDHTGEGESGRKS